MRYHQPQGYFRLYTTQLRESAQNNQDCQTPSLFRQPILQTAGLSQNPDSQKSEVQKSGNKQAPSIFIRAMFSVACLNIHEYIFFFKKLDHFMELFCSSLLDLISNINKGPFSSRKTTVARFVVI